MYFYEAIRNGCVSGGGTLKKFWATLSMKLGIYVPVYEGTRHRQFFSSKSIEDPSIGTITNMIIMSQYKNRMVNLVQVKFVYEAY